MAPPPAIDGYTDLEEIARGGFGVVYRARQERFDRVVALKVLSVMDLTDRDRQRFERECRAMGALSWHPNVVAVYDSGIADDGHPYLAMEFLSGGSFADHLADGVEPWADTVRACIQVAGALGAAHAAGTLHRDLKPENILRGPFGEAKLGDFGIAAVEGSGATTTGSASLTVAHVAPEIMAGERPDERADVYGLASTLHTLLTGRSPFSGESGEPVAALITRVLTAPAPRVAGVPDGLADLVQRTLSKDPGARPQSAEEFGRALQQVESDEGVARTELRLAANSGARDAPAAGGPAGGADTGDSTVTIVGLPRVPTSEPPPAPAPTPAPTPAPAPAPAPPPAPASVEQAPPTPVSSAPASPPTAPVPARPPSTPSSTSPSRAVPPARRSRRGLIVGVLLVLVVLAIGAIGAGVLLGGGSNGADERADGSTSSSGGGDSDTPAVDPTVTATVGTEPNPVGIAATGGAVWVTHAVDVGTVTRIDPATDSVVTTIPVGARPRGIAATDSAVWVANFDAGTVSRIDPATDTVVATIDVGGQPRGVAALDDVVWVTEVATDTVLRIDPATDTVVATIAVGAEPVRVEATADQVWVTNNDDDTVSRIDPATDTVVATVQVGDGPVSATVTDGAVWVTNAEGGSVVRIDPSTNEVAATIDVNEGVVFSAASSEFLWVANMIDGTLLRITLADDATLAPLPLGAGATGVAISGDAVFVTSTGEDIVSRVEPANG